MLQADIANTVRPYPTGQVNLDNIEEEASRRFDDRVEIGKDGSSVVEGDDESVGLFGKPAEGVRVGLNSGSARKRDGRPAQYSLS